MPWRSQSGAAKMSFLHHFETSWQLSVFWHAAAFHKPQQTIGPTMYRFLTMTLLNPSVILLALSSIAILNLWRRRVESRRRLSAATAAICGLYTIFTPGFSYLLLGSLEWRYPPRYDVPEDAGAIVVLGGYVRPEDHGRQAELGTFSLYRCLHALRLYRQRRLPLLVTGGKNADGLGPTQADAMRDFFRDHGVPPEDIWMEGRSRTTHENAVESARLLRQRGIDRVVLVTDAIHLRRAELSFARQGVLTIPHGTYYAAMSPPPLIEAVTPSAHSAADVERVVHEWLGLAWYSL